jgi:hypothetical protein
MQQNRLNWHEPCESVADWDIVLVCADWRQMPWLLVVLNLSFYTRRPRHRAEARPR